jgi:hypothetical protein
MGLLVISWDETRKPLDGFSQEEMHEVSHMLGNEKDAQEFSWAQHVGHQVSQAASIGLGEPMVAAGISHCLEQSC